MKKTISSLILPLGIVLFLAVYIIKGDNFFLGLSALGTVSMIISDEMDKLRDRIKKLEETKWLLVLSLLAPKWLKS